MVRVSFLDLKRQYEPIEGLIEATIREVLHSGRYILGAHVERFEEEFAKYCGAKYAVGVASGTDALILAIEASGAIIPGRGDEIITTSLSAPFTALAILHAGAIPIFVDIDPSTYTIDTTAVENAISERTKIVLPVHLYGQSADLTPLLKLAKAHNLIVIEDACQAHGAKYGPKRVGSHGTLAAFSFYPTKNIGAFGDGGMVVTNERDLYHRIRLLRSGREIVIEGHKIPGHCSRLDELQAGILLSKLRYLEDWNRERRRLAGLYKNELATHEGISLPIEKNYGRHVYHLFVIRHPDRDALRQHLLNRGIETLVHYPAALHQYEAFNSYKPSRLPVVGKCVRELVSLPLYPGIREDEICWVAESIKEFSCVGPRVQ